MVKVMHTEGTEEEGESMGAGRGLQGCCCSVTGQAEGMMHEVSG